MASVGFVSNERKELVVMFDEGLKDCCSHREASVSGHGESKKVSNSGTHDSIFLSFGSVK